MNTIFDQMMSRYEIKSSDDKNNALHEVMQQITLAGLYRAGFFHKAAFYGGTCLRIFHGLPRFSEDMDFTLLQAQDGFLL
ncbi:MAG TPA: nucleotidyl transferase AbiEii/AbiGii toxin family protein, partial [Bacteroidales bacterium]|nr:nucleotidyl transferase AbiEii/AbiGii toxin family protein [Bacteroidales bacterium]